MTEANQGTQVVESGHAVLGGHGSHGGDRGHGGHAISPEEMRRSLLIHDRVFKRSHEEIAGWLAVGSRQSVLDAGCGVGGMTAALAGLAGSVEAIDLDEANVAETRQRIEGAPNARVAAGDLTALPHDDAAFDLVWCSRVIHHVDDMMAAVKELARVTRPGGTVAIREGGVPFRVLPEDIGIGEAVAGGSPRSCRRWALRTVARARGGQRALPIRLVAAPRGCRTDRCSGEDRGVRLTQPPLRG